MAITPRRSTRGGGLFAPSPLTLGYAPPDTSFEWASTPISSTSAIAGPSKQHIYYKAYDRRESSTGQASTKKGKGRKKQEDEVSRFTLGDGVMVAIEGGNEGVGILINLWEESGENEEEEDDNKEEDDEDEEGSEPAEKGPKMMAEIHWCFRRQDLPGIMKNLQVDDNEVLLAASAVKPVTTNLPVSLLLRTVPIYSKAFFKEQYAPTRSTVKGWTYIKQGIYWCSRAFDKGARGGKVYRIDIDRWRNDGRAGNWRSPAEIEEIPEPLEDEDDDDAGSEFAGGENDGEDAVDVGDGMEDGNGKTPKRKRTTKTTPRKPSAKKAKTSTPSKSKKVKRLPHPKSSTSNLPSNVPSLDQLPVDPYQRALRLLHVGATPESLPCREEEFVDVLGRVEEGVESGGGGCLYIAGVPGTGKTATVHAVVKELKRKAEDGELAPFSYVEINGLKIPSPQHAYVVLWEAISGAKGCSVKTALRGLEAHFGRKPTGGVRGPRGHTFVVLMDELDQLLTAKQDVVYNFFNWPTMRDSQLFVIAVANRMDLPQHLATKIKSRLGLQTLLFQPYDRTSLIEIVQSRLIAHPKSKAEHKVLLPDAIALAATKMAGTNGDARRVLDACRRAVEVALEPKAADPTGVPHPVTAREMMTVLNLMSSSPVATFVRSCSVQQKTMMAAVLRCIRREGLPEIPWRSVRSDHDALTRSLAESNDLLTNSELALVLSSLVATHALTWAYDPYKAVDDRKVALGMEISEVGRVLMNEGDGWRRALAGV